MKKSILAGLFVTGLLTAVLAPSTNAIPPTDEAIEIWKAQGVLDQKIANWQQFKTSGGCEPFEHSPLTTFERTRSTALGEEVVDTLWVICIMVEFTDWPASGQNIYAQPSDFDSLLFSDRRFDAVYNDNGSMTEFYLENSYGQTYIKGDIYGWYMMPETYAHYVGSNDGLGGGGAELAGDAVDAAEAAGVDFSKYANGDAWVDGVVVIHAGAGAETGAYGIWSHRSSMSTRTYDGVNISAYTQNPEEYGGGISTMGVYGHEYGHILGLPDLYDINSNSSGNGLDDWSMMAGGSWNDQGRVPAHFDAWCKMQLGYVNVQWIDSNLHQVAFPQVEHNPVVYGLREDPVGSYTEYWLVENRQHAGFDRELPGEGLMIYHVDDAVAFQNNPSRYKVALEQADGDNDLALIGSSDVGDPYPGLTNNRAFHDQSLPHSRTNLGAISEVGVWEISNSDSIMYANLDVYFSQPWIEMAPTADSINFSDAGGGDGDGLFEAGETIEFTSTVINRMREAYNGVVTLTVDNDQLQFVTNGVALDGDLLTNQQVSHLTPISFTLPADFESVIAEFTLTITADSASGSGDQRYSQSFTFDQSLGAPQILIVDDDDGDTFEDRYQSTITDIRRPSEVWEKLSQGSPTGADLSTYNTVIWHTGTNLGGGGTLTASDIQAMKDFMDAGGDLFLASLTAASTLHSLDSAFMADYLHATLAGTGTFALGCEGPAGSEVAPGLNFRYDGSAPITPTHDRISPVGTGQEAFFLTDDLANGNFGTCGVSFVGNYRSLFMTYPTDFINDGSEGQGFMPKDTMLTRVLSFFTRSYPYVKTFDVPGENLNAVVSHTPEFGWTFQDTSGLTQAQYEFEVGIDNDWSTAELWATGVVNSTDTSLTYAGATLTDGATYYLRLRVGNGTDWSDWYENTFRMNSVPTAPVALGPADGQITGAAPTLYASGGSDLESTELWYQFEVYDDAGLTSIVTTSPDISAAGDSTAWTVDFSLAELTDHWWRVRAFDGAEYGDWSAAATFNVNSAYEPPTGALRILSQTFDACQAASTISQPVQIQASKPITAATIPIEIPAGVTIVDVSFSGLATATWDQNNVRIESDSGFLVVDIANSGGMTLPGDTTTAFNVNFTADPACQVATYIPWDTARAGIPGEQLSYTDTFEVFSPNFSVTADSTEIGGYTPGDLDETGSVDVGDLTFMIALLFQGGPPPCLLPAIDVNGDCITGDVGDLSYIIGFLFLGGDAPLCECSNGSAPPAKPQSGIVVSTHSNSEGQTVVRLSSDIDLRGLLLSVSGDSPAANLVKGRLNLLDGERDGTRRIGLIDLDGGEVIRTGQTEILAFDGPIEVVSAEVSDLNHRVWTASVAAGSASNSLPADYALDQNYPNPFNPQTQIAFALPKPGDVTLEVFNLLGRRVALLVNGPMEAGKHTITWDAAEHASGLYFYRLRAGDFTQTRKMMLLK